MANPVVCPECKTSYNFYKTTWANVGDNLTCGKCGAIVSGIKESG